MNRIVFLGIFIVLLCWQAGCADMISTVISSAGSAMINTAITGPHDEQYSTWLFAGDRSVISRDVSVADGIQSLVEMTEAGPMAIDEHVAGVRGLEAASGPDCIFDDASLPGGLADHIGMSGMLQQGRHIPR